MDAQRQRPTVFLTLCRARRPRRPETPIYRRMRPKLRNLQSTEILAKRMFQSFQNWQTFRFVRASAWSPGSLRDIQEFILKSKEPRSRPIPQIPRASVTLIEGPLATQHGRFSDVRKPPTPPWAAICRRSESRSKWQCGSHVLAAARGMGREIPADQRA
jgi:hypothetical protein